MIVFESDDLAARKNFVRKEGFLSDATMSQIPNSITICLPPSMSLADINADSLRYMVEAACQNSQEAFGQDGDIILYVREQEQDLEQQLVFETVDQEAAVSQEAVIQEKIDPGMLVDSINSIHDGTVIHLQGSELIPAQDSIVQIASTADSTMSDQALSALQLHRNAGQETVEARHENKKSDVPNETACVGKLPPNNPDDSKLTGHDKKGSNDDNKTSEGSSVIDSQKLQQQTPTGSHGSKIFRCNVCSYTGANKIVLKQHMMIHTEKKFCCKKCNYMCHTAGHLKRHTYTHSDSKPMLCPKCGYTCTRTSQMKIHLIQHETHTPFVCTLCDATYKKEESLKIHMLGHDNVTKFRCTHCSYSGNRYGDFKRHVLTHSFDKPLKCSVCSYTCIRQWRLKAHEKIHSQDKLLLRCDVCDFSCVSTPQLKDHKASHTQEGEIKCEICNFICTQPSRLKHHMKSHTPQKKCTSRNLQLAEQQEIKAEQTLVITADEVSQTTNCLSIQDTQSVTNQTAANQTVTSETADSDTVADQTVTKQTVTIDTVAIQTVDSQTAASQTVDSQTADSQTVEVADWVPMQIDEDQSQTFAAFTGNQGGEVYTITTSDGGQTYIIQTEVLPENILQELAPKEEPTEELKTHSKRFQCNECQFSCDYKSTLAIHMRKHNCVKKYQCAICKYMCIDKAKMREHFLGHTKSSDKRHTELTSDIKIQAEEKVHSCSECEYTCDSAQDLSSHISNHFVLKPFMCDVCNEAFSSHYFLKKHKLIHGETLRQCQFCDFKCAKKKQLTNHLQEHKHQQLFCCNLCSATYKKEPSLKIHMMSHQNINKFVCSLCNYAGNRSADFRRHLLTHSASKPLRCTQCSYSCIRQSRLTAHMLVHSEDRTGSRRIGSSLPKAYQCAFCEFTCTRASRLKAHISKVHLDLPENVVFSIDFKQIVQQ